MKLGDEADEVMNSCESYQDCLLFCFFFFCFGVGWGGMGELYGCHSICLPVL